MRGAALNSRLPVNGIQCASSQAESVRVSLGLVWFMVSVDSEENLAGRRPDPQPPSRRCACALRRGSLDGLRTIVSRPAARSLCAIERSAAPSQAERVALCRLVGAKAVLSERRTRLGHNAPQRCGRSCCGVWHRACKLAGTMANRYRTSAVLGMLVWTSAGVAWADRNITLDDALGLARAHNRDLRAARDRVVEADAGVAQARAALFPTIAARGTYTHNYKEVDFDAAALLQPTFAIADAIKGTTTNTAEMAAIDAAERNASAALSSQPAVVIQKMEELDGVVSASVPVLAPPLYYQLSAAQHNRDASGANYQVTEAGVLVWVAQASFAAAGTDELVVARQDAVKVATETFDVAKARVAAELANQVESTRAETALVRAQQDLTEAENARGAAYRALATLIGTREAITVQTAPSLPGEPGAFETLVGEARTRRPEIAADRKSVVEGKRV